LIECPRDPDCVLAISNFLVHNFGVGLDQLPLCGYSDFPDGREFNARSHLILQIRRECPSRIFYFRLNHSTYSVKIKCAPGGSYHIINMDEVEFSNSHSVKLRMAVALLLQSDDWRGVYFKFSDLRDALNVLCGYNEDDEKMKKVDDEMILEAFKLKGACARADKLQFSSSVLIWRSTSWTEGPSEELGDNEGIGN